MIRTTVACFLIAPRGCPALAADSRLRVKHTIECSRLTLGWHSMALARNHTASNPIQSLSFEASFRKRPLVPSLSGSGLLFLCMECA